MIHVIPKTQAVDGDVQFVAFSNVRHYVVRSRVLPFVCLPVREHQYYRHSRTAFRGGVQLGKGQFHSVIQVRTSPCINSIHVIQRIDAVRFRSGNELLGIGPNR